jgi:hypothetical protein
MSAASSAGIGWIRPNATPSAADARRREVDRLLETWDCGRAAGEVALQTEGLPPRLHCRSAKGAKVSSPRLHLRARVVVSPAHAGGRKGNVKIWKSVATGLSAHVLLSSRGPRYPPFLIPPTRCGRAELKGPELRPCADGAEASGQ